MTKNRSLVRASDIGMWAFCQRAWWLAQVKGAPHRNPAVLQRGESAHRAHGFALLRAQWLQRAGLALVALALLVAGLLLLFLLLREVPASLSTLSMVRKHCRVCSAGSSEIVMVA